MPGAVLLASLMGSAHCAGMCSGLILALAPTRGSVISYHAGRLLGYSSLGFAAGYLGKVFFESNISFIMSWVTLILLSATLVYLGGRQFLNISFHANSRNFFSKMYHWFWVRLVPLKGTWTGIIALGILSAFLPCGWLYTFVVAAAATASPYSGLLMLSIFWLGTIPALSAAPFLVKNILLPLKHRAPRASGILLILAGFFTVFIRGGSLLAEEQKAKATQVTSPAAPQGCLLHKHLPTR